MNEEESDAPARTRKGCCCRRTPTSTKLASVKPSPRLPQAMKQDLIRVQTTKFICNKPFDQMNPVEK